MVLDIQLNDLGFIGIIVLSYVIYSLSEIRKDVSCMHDQLNDICSSLDAIGNMTAHHLDFLGVKAFGCCDEEDTEDNREAIKAWDEQD